MVGVGRLDRQNFLLMLPSHMSVITCSDQLLLLFFPYISLSRNVTSDPLCTTSVCDCEENFKYACFDYYHVPIGFKCFFILLACFPV